MKITIIGCGNMGLIYARAFLKYNIVSKENLLLVEKSEARKQELIKLNVGEVTVPNDPKIADCDLIIIAVKPQDFEALAVELKPILQNARCIISIMAGMKISRIEKALNNPNILRAMPNSPAELGMGMTAFTANAAIPIDQIRKAESVLGTTGRCLYLEKEELLDAVTALSGSGPAYFFYIVKHMIEAGKQMGFDEAAASLFVKQTMLGAFHLISNGNKSLDELIKSVASKGGATEAALTVFNATQVGENIQMGIIKARDRSEELSK
jgi:pyrroline-5-carboxylate reductase